MRLALALVAMTLTLWLAPAAGATYSIVIGDRDTGEVAVGTVTCLEGFDLLAFVPVVRVGHGAAAVQAAGDFDGVRRQIIFDELGHDTPLEEILALLEPLEFHDALQYGFADVHGDALSFTGPSTEPWSGGVTGTLGSLSYAIQGNSLVGACVVDAIEMALVTTDGDVPARLMAGMEAAREAGGDGRCSCSLADPDGCACPPPFFVKNGHVGGMIVSRIGDTDDPACTESGCADGDYFMRFNVAFAVYNDSDPVVQLRGLYDAWRNELEGRPDAVTSGVTFEPVMLPPNGVSTTRMRIALRDWTGTPITAAIESVNVEHAEASAGISAIGEIVADGPGEILVTLTAGSTAGIDRFVITVDDGIRPVTLTPPPALQYYKLGDLDGDGKVSFDDVRALLSHWGRCPERPQSCLADLNGSGRVDFDDLLIMLGRWG